MDYEQRIYEIAVADERKMYAKAGLVWGYDQAEVEEKRFFSVNVKYRKTSYTERWESINAESAIKSALTVLSYLGVKKEEIESLSVVELIKTENGFEIK